MVSFSYRIIILPISRYLCSTFIFIILYTKLQHNILLEKISLLKHPIYKHLARLKKRGQNDKTYGVLQKASYKTLKNEIMCNTNTKCNHQWSQSFCYWRFVSSLDVWEADLTGEFSSRYQGMQERKRLIPRQVWPIPLCFTDTSAAECRLICTISVDNIPCYIDT